MDEGLGMMKDEKNYIILDVRRPDEYSEGHIPGAINVPNEEIGTAEIAALPDKSQLIFVYCRSGRRSKEAAEKLVALGYTNIVEFGGILDYHGEIEK
jgi:rhodanese-related sulfurtransferase